MRALIETLEERLLLAKFGVIGDFTAGQALLDVSNMMKSWSPDYVFTVGDNSYDADPTIDTTAGQYFRQFIYPYTGSYGAGGTAPNRFFPALGNHDWDNSANAQEYLNFFTLPGNERYYNVVTGNVEWFIIDSDPREPSGRTSTSVQGQWLQARLAASTVTFKVVLDHHPPFSSGEHGNETVMQWPYKQWGATAVLSGHDHNYERLIVGGLPYFVNGLGGAEIRGFGGIVSGSQVRYNGNFGAMLVESSPTALDFKFYARTGALIDNYVIPAPAQTSTLVASGSSWKYLANGSNQMTAWRAPGFVDTSWSTGNAQLGYGDGDEATTVPFGSNSNNKWVTTYFRKSFNVADPSSIAALNLELLRDDGAVVYLNGNEVWRSNMPAGTIAFNTFASTTVGGGDESTFFVQSISPTGLVAGNNVLAVEVHQSVPDSSDLSFDLRLIATLGSPTLPTAPSGLVATTQGTTQVNLTWLDNSNNESGFFVERSVNGGAFAQIGSVTTPSYIDSAVQAADKYVYRVRAWNAAGNSTYSNVWGATIPGALYVNTGTTWRYFDAGVNLGTSWRTKTYDDLLWNSGASQLGYGEGDEATIVSYGRGVNNKHITTYFRNSFFVASPSAVTGLTIELLRDDGAVVYINGVEAWRSNMPAGTINYKTLAASSVADAAETTYYTQTISPSLLSAGMNVIAVEVHQSAANSTDVSFDLRLRAAMTPPPAGPSAISALRATAISTTRIDLSWIDTVTTETGFRIFRSTNGTTFTQIDQVMANSTGYSDTTVSPGTQYWYRVYSFNAAAQGPSSSIATATTPAADEMFIAEITDPQPIKRDTLLAELV